MERFGGWVGSDTDDLHPTFTVETIEGAIYPYPLEAVPADAGPKVAGGRK